MIKVVAAIIKKDNLYLIARRAKHKDHAGKWEFPGGKIDQGETPQKALERELFEEFGVFAKTGLHIATVKHDYRTFKIELMAFEVSISEEPLKLTDHDQIAWVTREEMGNYELSGADIGICKAILPPL